MTLRPFAVRNRLQAWRSFAAPIAKTALLYTGGFASLRRLLPSRQVAILRYHAICGPEGYAYASPGICISPDAFERHVAYLAERYAVLQLPDVVSALSNGTPLPRNAVVITFDDGYADNLAAARTLHKYGLSATFYLTAGCLADGQPFWPSEMRHLLTAIAEPRATLRVGDKIVVLDLATAEGRSAAVARLTRTFKSNTIPVRDEFRRQLRALAGVPELPRVMLTWDEVREMHALGMTIGSHTMTHPNLPSAGVAAAREELIASRRRLEGEIGAPVTMFSYPNGGADRYFTTELQAVVREAGYQAAASSRNAFAGRHSDLFALERIEVEESLQDLAFALEVERFAFAPVS